MARKTTRNPSRRPQRQKLTRGYLSERTFWILLQGLSEDGFRGPDFAIPTRGQEREVSQ